MANDKEKRLRLGQLNVRSLNTGQDEFIVTVLKYKIDILAINESWIKDGEEVLAPSIPQYRFVHKARIGKRGGGVGFYVRRGIVTKILQHPHSMLEQLWIEVRLSGGTLALGTAYRPEDISVQDALDSLSESINVMSHCDYICVLGDLNINLLSVESVQSREFLLFSNQHNMVQLVDEPTRVTDNTESLLDIVLTDDTSRCKNIKVVHNRCLSDHATVMADFDLRKPKFIKQVIYKRSLHNIVENQFNADLNSIPWQCILQEQRVDDMVATFNCFVLALFDLHAPIIKHTIRDRQKPWITETIKLMMHLRDEALKRYHKVKTDAAKLYYRSLRNFVTTALKQEKKSYFNSQINSNLNKPNILWKKIKETVPLNNTRTSCIPDHINDPNVISDYFLTLPACNNIDVDDVTADIKMPKLPNTFDLKPTSETEVFKIINSITTNSTGLDGLNIRMIKLTLPKTLPIITAIINKSIETNTFPEQWKAALVRPIPKNTSPNELKDLRPISILPILSKVLEKVVLSQVVDHLDKNSIIPKFQSGFRRGHGTETALLHVTDDLSEASDMGWSSILILLDYTRAFDCLHPQLLLAKLSHYGFSSNTCRWFETYLTNREQTVVAFGIDGEKMLSSPKVVPRGVPQGAILSPVLFTIFTADLPQCLQKCKYHLYADDTQLYYSFKAKDTERAIKNVNDDLQNIYSWSEKNSLVLNPNKSRVLILGTKQQIKGVFDCNVKVSINNIVLEEVKTARNLGLVLDGEQKYVEHVNGKIRTAFFKLKILYKIRPYLSTEMRQLLVDLLVLSPFNFCSSVFGPRLNTCTERAIQRVQNACIRFCFDVPRREFITPYLNRKRILNMKARAELHYACTVHRVIWNKKPEYLFEKLTWVKDNVQRSLRTATQNRLQIPKHHSTRYRGSFSFYAASIWNDLPPPMTAKMSTDCFKNRYKSALLKRQLAAENIVRSYWKELPLKNYFVGII